MKSKIKDQRSKIFFGLFFAVCLWLMASVFVSVVKADAVTDNALDFLRDKQDESGKITTGFSAPSQWSAVAFAINGVDVATVKKFDKTLLDYLLSDVPTNETATEYESRILAIVAIGKNPTDFNGKNYVSSLESFYKDGQIGDECASTTPEVKKYNTNDDIYGLLALVASGSTSNTEKKQSILNFLISQQDATDGGFSWIAPGCDWYETSADMTAAAIQALVAARDNGLSHAELDNAIERAKQYLLNNQHVADGGFGYYGSSDPDSTNLVLQAFNVLDMKDSEQAVKARNYLLALQSATDGGFMAYDWGTSTFVSNSTTTAQAIIALSGNGLVIKIFDPSVGQTPPANSPSNPSASSGQASSPTSTPTPAPTATPTPTATSTPTPTPVVIAVSTVDDNPTPTPLSPIKSGFEGQADIPEKDVLGVETENKNNNNLFIAWFFAGLGVVFVFIYLAKQFIIKK